ncbi:putative uncharacterized protein DDB_G0282133 [Galleria mellonella]|uniref:Uncharacterized protein n=1 Tax=Galleria mellonella TaxID=7137 RepID=A0A6J3BV93_GALME|nr:putative uncharacterized protein DDB_G0282133 [Galleria mellonella]
MYFLYFLLFSPFHVLCAPQNETVNTKDSLLEAVHVENYPRYGTKISNRQVYQYSITKPKSSYDGEDNSNVTYPIHSSNVIIQYNKNKVMPNTMRRKNTNNFFLNDGYNKDGQVYEDSEILNNKSNVNLNKFVIGNKDIGNTEITKDNDIYTAYNVVNILKNQTDMKDYFISKMLSNFKYKDENKNTNQSLKDSNFFKEIDESSKQTIKGYNPLLNYSTIIIKSSYDPRKQAYSLPGTSGSIVQKINFGNTVNNKDINVQSKPETSNEFVNNIIQILPQKRDLNDSISRHNYYKVRIFENNYNSPKNNSNAETLGNNVYNKILIKKNINHATEDRNNSRRDNWSDIISNVSVEVTNNDNENDVIVESDEISSEGNNSKLSNTEKSNYYFPNFEKYNLSEIKSTKIHNNRKEFEESVIYYLNNRRNDNTEKNSKYGVLSHTEFENQLYRKNSTDNADLNKGLYGKIAEGKKTLDDGKNSTFQKFIINEYLSILNNNSTKSGLSNSPGNSELLFINNTNKSIKNKVDWDEIIEDQNTINKKQYANSFSEKPNTNINNLTSLTINTQKILDSTLNKDINGSLISKSSSEELLEGKTLDTVYKNEGDEKSYINSKVNRNSLIFTEKTKNELKNENNMKKGNDFSSEKYQNSKLNSKMVLTGYQDKEFASFYDLISKMSKIDKNNLLEYWKMLVKLLKLQTNNTKCDKNNLYLILRILSKLNEAKRLDLPIELIVDNIAYKVQSLVKLTNLNSGKMQASNIKNNNNVNMFYIPIKSEYPKTSAQVSTREKEVKISEILHTASAKTKNVSTERTFHSKLTGLETNVEKTYTDIADSKTNDNLDSITENTIVKTNLNQQSLPSNYKLKPIVDEFIHRHSVTEHLSQNNVNAMFTPVYTENKFNQHKIITNGKQYFISTPKPENFRSTKANQKLENSELDTNIGEFSSVLDIGKSKENKDSEVPYSENNRRMINDGKPVHILTEFGKPKNLNYFQVNVQKENADINSQSNNDKSVEVIDSLKNLPWYKSKTTGVFNYIPSPFLNNPVSMQSSFKKYNRKPEEDSENRVNFTSYVTPSIQYEEDNIQMQYISTSPSFDHKYLLRKQKIATNNKDGSNTLYQRLLKPKIISLGQFKTYDEHDSDLENIFYNTVSQENFGRVRKIYKNALYTEISRIDSSTPLSLQKHNIGQTEHFEATTHADDIDKNFLNKFNDVIKDELSKLKISNPETESKNIRFKISHDLYKPAIKNFHLEDGINRDIDIIFRNTMKYFRKLGMSEGLIFKIFTVLYNYVLPEIIEKSVRECKENTYINIEARLKPIISSLLKEYLQDKY